jgi:hypothetical protein
MNRDQAAQAAQAARHAFAVPDHYHVRSVEQRIVELVEGETAQVRDGLPDPGPRYDLLCWVVTFGGRGAAHISLTVDSATGRVVRVRGSR